jgi:5'-nucleotidase
LNLADKDADSGVRVFNSARHHGLDITLGAFTDGRDAWLYLEPVQVDLFLSAEPAAVPRPVLEATGQGRRLARWLDRPYHAATRLARGRVASGVGPRTPTGRVSATPPPPWSRASGRARARPPS